jgi:acetolactate synthase-1/2/3 large subunit
MDQIKVSDYIAKFVVESGITHVFGVTGGSALHLIHSIVENGSLTFVSCHDERSAAMAADGYARASNTIGVVISTSGPGATNLITGIAGAYFDSIPLIVISGQVSTFRLKGSSKIRQRGFQETPIIEMVSPITKYQHQITNKDQVPEILNTAKEFALKGRSGPVWIDIPDNIQRQYISKAFVPNQNLIEEKVAVNSSVEVSKMLEGLSKANRPLIIVGFGVHLSKAELLFNQVALKMKIPIVATWGAASIVSEENDYYLGTFGTHGMRHANRAVHESDFILSIGARLDLKSTGTPPSDFAPFADKFVVDIDPAEIEKLIIYEVKHMKSFVMDAGQFLTIVEAEIQDLEFQTIFAWRKYLAQIQENYSEYDKRLRSEASLKKVNPYDFFGTLYESILSPSALVFDTGCTIAWGMQTLIRNNNIKTFHDFNNTAMGWSVPASIGIQMAGLDNIICLVGDGSIMFALNELVNLNKYARNIKIFLFNNGGYGMIRQTQDQWLDGNHYASGNEGGLDFPNFSLIAASIGIKYQLIDTAAKCESELAGVINSVGNIFCELAIEPNNSVIPIVKAGSVNIYMEPPLLEDTQHFSANQKGLV